MALSSAATHLNVTQENRNLPLSLRKRISCIKKSSYAAVNAKRLTCPT